MTVEDVKELYIDRGLNLVDTARILNVNLSSLRSFMVRNGITKDEKILKKLDSSKQAIERWKKLNSVAITNGDFEGGD